MKNVIPNRIFYFRITENKYTHHLPAPSAGGSRFGKLVFLGVFAPIPNFSFDPKGGTQIQGVLIFDLLIDLNK